MLLAESQARLGALESVRLLGGTKELAHTDDEANCLHLEIAFARAGS